MKNFFKNHGFTLIFGIICIATVSLVITYNFDNLVFELEYQMNQINEESINYASNYRMIGYGDDNMRNQPLSATIENNILKVKGKITNNTGKKLTVRDYARISFGGYEYAANVNFEGTGVLNNGSSLEVEFETNISNLKKINILPTTVYAYLGTDDSNNNYYEFDLKYVISWYN